MNLNNLVKPNVITFKEPLTAEQFESFLQKLSANGIETSYVLNQHRNFRNGQPDHGTCAASGMMMRLSLPFAAGFSTQHGHDTSKITALEIAMEDDSEESETSPELAFCEYLRVCASAYKPKSDGAKG
jgi:hypothetical protein